MTWEVVEGDCRELMAQLPAESVDAVVCDPPYGLEFMGKGWDNLEDDLPQAERWRGRRGKSQTSLRGDQSKPSGRSGVSYGGRRSAFNRCQLCGRREFSGTPCACPAPAWVVEYPAGAPTGMIRMQRWHEAWASEALRILKPGGHLVAFGAPRTYHRLTCGLEDAGFEIRDALMWLFGSGFPKSRDISKDLDAAAGAAREPLAARSRSAVRPETPDQSGGVAYRFAGAYQETAPATDLAKQWDGWGTALKPGYEPIALARKPLAGTVAANVTRYGTGGLNVAGCRLDTMSTGPGSTPPSSTGGARGSMAAPLDRVPYDGDAGRWPPNVALDPFAAAMLDDMTGERAAGNHPGSRRGIGFTENGGGRNAGTFGEARRTETGGASRFFYCPKASRPERDAGLMRFPERALAASDDPEAAATIKRARNHHPTVKPVALLRWLVRLVTPPGGLVADPFAGSGSMGMAALLEGMSYWGAELDPEGEGYPAIARARIGHVDKWRELWNDPAVNDPASLFAGL